MTHVTTHTTYGKTTGSAFTFQVRDFTDEELGDILSTALDHGNLDLSRADGHWFVGITDDNGDLEQHATITDAEVNTAVRTLAFERGWINLVNDTNYAEVDLGQFDAWDLGMMLQEAAFGAHIVG